MTLAVRDLLFVIVGGGLGSGARYLLSASLARPDAFLPWHTLAANLVGCFLLGFIAELGVEGRYFSREMGLALTTGFMGGLTTFSTFALETTTLGSRRVILAAVYVAVSVIAGLTMAWVGQRAVRLLLT